MEQFREFTVTETEIIVIRPFSVMRFLVCFLVYPIAAFGQPLLSLSTSMVFSLSSPALLWLAAAAAVWLKLAAGIRMVTTFDLKRREIRRRNLFGFTRTFRFSDIAAVVPAADEKGRWFYTMLPKRNLYGPGLPLTGRYRWSPQLAYLSEYLIPAVSTALFGCSDGAPLLESEEEALQGKPPEQPKIFRKKRDREIYTYSRAGTAAASFALAAVFFLLMDFLMHRDGHTGFLAGLAFGVCLLYPFTFYWAVRFDLEKGVCTLALPFYFLRNTLVMNRYLTVEAGRLSAGLLFIGTWLCADGFTAKNKHVRCTIRFTRLLSGRISTAALEAQQILDAYMNRRLMERNAEAGEEFIPVVRRPYLQVPLREETDA